MINAGTKMTAEEQEQPEIETTGEETSSELNEPCWSLISFESIAAHGLTYAEARSRLEEMQKENISGLCVVTDEAAARMTESQSRN